MDTEEFGLIKQKAADWASVNAKNDFYYGSPQSWWAAALNASVITKDEYEGAKVRYGNLWNYRGD